MAGEYDNTRYGPTIVNHMCQMKRAGVDFAAASWDPGATHYEHVLDACEDAGMKATVLYESLSHADPKRKRVGKEALGKIAYDMEALADDLADPAWLKIGGRPVVMLYVTRCYEDADEMFPAIREALGDVYLVADEVFWGGGVKEDRLKHFDAVTSYNWYRPGKWHGNTEQEACDTFLANVRDCASRNAATCRKMGVPYWPVAMPGYDDTGVRPKEEHPPLPRMGGYLFDRSLQDGITQDPECLMVCSFSEWFEDTQIEPCGSYGDLYLDILRSHTG